MKRVLFISFLMFLTVGLTAQVKFDLPEKLKSQTKKGDYVILELRLNKEDEFRTMEGGKSSLARIAVYTGKNNEDALITKGFDGMNSVLLVLNDLKQNGFRLVEVYTVKGESLIVTHYVLERKK